MKTITRSVKLPVEIGGVPAGELRIVLAVDGKYLPLLDAQGFDGQALINHAHKVVQEAVDALDGCVTGLIVSNLEEF